MKGQTRDERFQKLRAAQSQLLEAFGNIQTHSMSASEARNFLRDAGLNPTQVAEAWNGLIMPGWVSLMGRRRYMLTAAGRTELSRMKKEQQS